MEIIHLGIVILSAIFAAGNAQKGIYCVDPHTGLYYPVNSTWPSSTFCGTYTCNAKLVTKDNTTAEFDSTPTLESTLQNQDDFRKNYEVGISFEDLDDESTEGSGENIEDEDNDFSKTIENVLQASKELNEVSGEIHDIAKHVRLYKAANDLLKSITKTENIDKLSTEDTEKLLKALTNTLVKNGNEMYKEDGLDTADTLNIYHNVNHKYSTPISNITEYSKNSVDSSNEPFYDYSNMSPYFSYYPSYFYSSPLYQPPYLNDENRPINAYIPNEKPADNDINASNIKENYQNYDSKSQNLDNFLLRQPFPDFNHQYSDQYIKYWTSRGYNFPSYNTPITPSGNSYMSDNSNYNSQHQFIPKQNPVNKYTKNNNHNTAYHDSNSHLNYVKSHHHYHGIEKTDKYHPGRSNYKHIQKHSYKNIEHGVNETPFKYYPFNFDGPNHKVKDDKSNIAYYYYDPMKNEYTMNVPKNYTEYETFYKDYMNKYSKSATPVNEESIMDLNEYYKKYYSNEQNGISQNEVIGREDGRQNSAHIQEEVLKKHESKIRPMEYIPSIGQEDRRFGTSYFSSPPNTASKYLNSAESKEISSSEESDKAPSYKYETSNSHVHDNEEFKMADNSKQWESIEEIFPKKSNTSSTKDFTLRVSSKSVASSEEASNQSKTNNDSFMGTHLGSKLFKPIRLLNVNPFTTFNPKRGLRRISKRSLNYSLSEKDTKNGRRKWRSYITVQGCPETLEPGYFRSGDVTKHYPLCCPQKILNN